MDSNSQQDADLLQRVDMLGKKIALLEKLSSEILTSLNHLTQNTKESYSQLQGMQPLPAQNTLLQLQEENHPPEAQNVENIPEETNKNEQNNQDEAEPPQTDPKNGEIPTA